MAPCAILKHTRAQHIDILMNIRLPFNKVSLLAFGVQMVSIGDENWSKPVKTGQARSHMFVE